MALPTKGIPEEEDPLKKKNFPDYKAKLEAGKAEAQTSRFKGKMSDAMREVLKRRLTPHQKHKAHVAHKAHKAHKAHVAHVQHVKNKK